MSKIKINGTVIPLSTTKYSSPSLRFSSSSGTYYGELSTIKPSHNTISVSKGNTRYYLVNSEKSQVVANSNGSYYWKTNWVRGNDNAGLGYGSYDNKAALDKDADVSVWLGSYTNTRLIMNLETSISSLKSRFKTICIAFDNRIGLTSTHGGGNDPYLDSSYDWSRTCRGNGPQQTHPMTPSEISEPKRFTDQNNLTGAEKVVKFPTANIDTNGGWYLLFQTPKVAECAINNRRRKGRFSGGVTNYYYFRVRNDKQVEILIRSSIGADADGGGPIANAAGKISAIIWVER